MLKKKGFQSKDVGERERTKDRLIPYIRNFPAIVQYDVLVFSFFQFR